jgi:serine/threonine protein phosphatase 1
MIIIGDVHGCFKTLMALIDKLPRDRNISFVGDLIDRGPLSRDVVKFVRENDHRCVIGNHEDMSMNNSHDWLKHGGMQTFSSYSSDEKGWEDDQKWFKELPYFIEFPELKDEEGRALLISHSSAGPAWELDHEGDEFKHSLMWNRKNPSSPNGFYNIFGHTPQRDGALVGDDFANIDTGVFYEDGHLTAMLFPEKIIITQELIDDVKFKA